MDDDVGGGGLLRERDMIFSSKFDSAVKHKIITKGKWDASNRCCLYLMVLSVANISTGDGLPVDINYWKGTIKSGRTRYIDWYYQGKLCIKDWSTRRRVLMLSICYRLRRQLSIRLGSWIESYATKALPKWGRFWNANTNSLYHK